MPAVMQRPSLVRAVEVPAGTIYAPEVPGAYLIVHGRLRFIHVTDEGHTVATGVLGADEAILVRRPWLPGSPSGYVEAFEYSRLLGVRERDVAEMVARRPDFAAAVVHALMRQAGDLVEAMCDLALTDARERVLRTLIRLAERHGEASPDDDFVRIAIPLRHEDLATLVGTCRETVTSVLADLTRAGAVRNGRASIAVSRERAIALLEAFHEDRRRDASA